MVHFQFPGRSRVELWSVWLRPRSSRALDQPLKMRCRAISIRSRPQTNRFPSIESSRWPTAQISAAGWLPVYAPATAKARRAACSASAARHCTRGWTGRTSHRARTDSVTASWTARILSGTSRSIPTPSSGSGRPTSRWAPTPSGTPSSGWGRPGKKTDPLPRKRFRKQDQVLVVPETKLEAPPRLCDLSWWDRVRARHLPPLRMGPQGPQGLWGVQWEKQAEDQPHRGHHQGKEALSTTPFWGEPELLRF